MRAQRLVVQGNVSKKSLKKSEKVLSPVCLTGSMNHWKSRAFHYLLAVSVLGNWLVIFSLVIELQIRAPPLRPII